MGQEFGTGPRVGSMFPVDNLRLPIVALISVAAATAISSMLDLVTHLPLGYNNWLLEVC